jgi:hypothetical protein
MTPTMDTPVMDVATTSETEHWPELTAAERCDARTTGLDGVRSACGAAALVRWVTPTGNDLVFCAHHSLALEPGLLAQNAKLVTDQRDLLKS